MVNRTAQGWLAKAIVAGLTVQMAIPLTAYAVDCVSFSVLQNPSSTEADRFNVKLTFVDMRLKMINSLVFRKAGVSINIEPAAACHKAGVDYTADADPFTSFGVTATQLQRALDSLATMSSLTDGGLDTLACLSVVVLDSNGSSSRVFDSVVDESTARTTVRKLQLALAGNDSAVAGLSAAACRFGIPSVPLGTDVTSRVEVTLSGARYRRIDSLYVVTAKVKNTSGTTLTGPAVLVVRFEGSVAATAPDGFTACNADPPGTAYFRILGSGASLSPNASTTVVIALTNRSRQPIRPLRLRVLGGV